MSVQLILYPQNYNGTYSFTSTPVLNQYVADGNFSTGINNATSTTNTYPSNYALLNSVAISAWRSFRSTGGTYSNTTPPSITSAGLNLYSSTGSFSSSGVYQLISNLTSGVCYEVKITVTGTTGTLTLGNTKQNNWTVSVTNYSNLGSSAVYLGTPTGILTHQFTAVSSHEVLVLDYKNYDGSTIIISNVSITECPATATLIYSDLADGQVICDLYEDEAIPLSLSIDDFKNVAEKTQSYSKDFHLPNTKRNNKIFSHIFEVTRTTDAFSFNPYVKTKAILKEDSYTLFEGFLQLIDIKDKESEISYNVNLYSEAVTLKDILDNKTFADIDFTELQHDYTITNIKNSWVDTTGLTLENALATGSFALVSGLANTKTNVLKYPFVNWRGDWSIDNSNNIVLQDLEQVFRPWIQIRYLLKRIINEAGFEFVSNFFDTSDFKKLFMDFNWGQGLGSSEVFENITTTNKDETIIFAGTSFTELEIGTPTSENPTGIAGTYLSGNRITATNNNTTIQVSYTGYLYNSTTITSHTVETKWVHYDSSGAVITDVNQTPPVTLPATTGSFPKKYYWSGSFSRTMQDGDYLIPYFKSDVANRVFQSNYSSYLFGGSVGFWLTSPSTFSFQLTSIQTAASSLLHSIRGEINQWEFLKGIMTMFNLVVLKEDEILRIEPYADIFVKPIHALNTTATAVKPVQHNWTDKVDISEINLKPLELVKKTTFTYEDDGDDFSLNVYKKATSGYLYGTKKFNGSTATNSQMTNLIGEEEIIATPFAPTLLRPATDLFPADLTIPHIYSGNEDGTEFEDFENLPRILYNLGVKPISGQTYFVPAQNTGPQINAQTDFLQFGHLTEIPITTTTVDYNFDSAYGYLIGAAPIDNLYQVYYSPYYDELYHPDTRVMTMKVNLTPADIQNFKFYDTVVIKSREYRVNKIEYKPKTLAKVEFILIP